MLMITGKNLVPNHDGGVTDYNLSWVPGWLNFAANTPTIRIKTSCGFAKIGSYNKKMSAFINVQRIYTCALKEKQRCPGFEVSA